MSHNIILAKEVGQALGLQFSQISTVFAARVVIEHDRLVRLLQDAVRQSGTTTCMRTNGKLRGLVQLGEERLHVIFEFVKQHRAQYGHDLDSDRIARILSVAERLDAAMQDARRTSDSSPWERQRNESRGQFSSPQRHAETMGVAWSHREHAGRGTLSPPLDSSPLAADPGARNASRPRGFLRDHLDDDPGRPSMAYGNAGGGGGVQRGGAIRGQIRPHDEPPQTRDRTPPRSTRSGPQNFDDMPVGARNNNNNNFDDMPVGGARNNNNHFDERPIRRGANLDDVPVGPRRQSPPINHHPQPNFDDVPVGGGRSAAVPHDEMPAVRRGGVAMEFTFDENNKSEPAARPAGVTRPPPSRFQKAAPKVIEVPVEPAPSAAPTRGPPAALRARLEQRNGGATKPAAEAQRQAPQDEVIAAPPRSREEEVVVKTEKPPASGSNFSAPVAATSRSAAVGVTSALTHTITNRYYAPARRGAVTLQCVEDVIDFESETRMELFATARAQLLEIIAAAVHDIYTWQRRVVHTAKGIEEKPGRRTVTASRQEYSLWSFVVVAPVLMLIGAFIVLPIYTAMRKVVG